MDRHLAVIVLIIVIVASPGTTMSATTGTSTQPKSDNSSMGSAVSSFMQVSVVEVDSTVKQEMWEESFENADTESEKAALLKQRSQRLSQELSSIRSQRKQLDGGGENAEYTRTALDAEVIELRESIRTMSQTANETNINNSNLSSLRQKACTVTVSNRSSLVNTTGQNETGLPCPPIGSVDNGSNTTARNGTDAGPVDNSSNTTVGNDTDTKPDTGNGSNETVGNGTDIGPSTPNPVHPPTTGTETTPPVPDTATDTMTETESETPRSSPTPNSTSNDTKSTNHTAMSIESNTTTVVTVPQPMLLTQRGAIGTCLR